MAWYNETHLKSYHYDIATTGFRENFLMYKCSQRFVILQGDEITNATRIEFIYMYNRSFALRVRKCIGASNREHQQAVGEFLTVEANRPIQRA